MYTMKTSGDKYIYIQRRLQETSMHTVETLGDMYIYIQRRHKETSIYTYNKDSRRPVYIYIYIKTSGD